MGNCYEFTNFCKVNLKNVIFTDIDDCPGTCETAPAGLCMDGIGTFTCMCNTGYTGSGQSGMCTGE